MRANSEALLFTREWRRLHLAQLESCLLVAEREEAEHVGWFSSVGFHSSGVCCDRLAWVSSAQP